LNPLHSYSRAQPVTFLSAESFMSHLNNVTFILQRTVKGEMEEDTRRHTFEHLTHYVQKVRFLNIVTEFELKHKKQAHPYITTLKMEATCSSETSVDFQRTTERYSPQDTTFHNHRCKNLKFTSDTVTCISDHRRGLDW
jgi:hypothetical protein